MSTLWVTIDVFGWLGAVILIGSYGLISYGSISGLSYGSISGRSVSYQSLNVLGSILLIINTAWHRAWPSSVVNLVWVGIAIGALIRGVKDNSAEVDGPD